MTTLTWRRCHFTSKGYLSGIHSNTRLGSVPQDGQGKLGIKAHSQNSGSGLCQVLRFLSFIKGLLQRLTWRSWIDTVSMEIPHILILWTLSCPGTLPNYILNLVFSYQKSFIQVCFPQRRGNWIGIFLCDPCFEHLHSKRCRDPWKIMSNLERSQQQFFFVIWYKYFFVV